MIYVYEASDEKGAIIRGEVNVASRKAVVEYLEKSSLIPISIEKKGEIKEAKGLSKSFFERITPLDRILIVRNLAATLRAGLSITEALDILIADAKKNIMRSILVQAKANLQNGQPLSYTFHIHRRMFPLVFVGMMRAGESAGKLDSVLDELGVHLEREYDLTKKVRSALAYPFLLLIGSIGVILLLLLFVLPRISGAFKQSGADLPFLTKLLIGASDVMAFSPILDLVVVGILVWIFVYFRKTDFGRRFFIRVLLRIPGVKELVKKVAIVRFARTLGSLIGGGTPILEALDLSAHSVGNDIYKKAVLESAESVKKGVPLAESLGHHQELFPRFLTSLTAVGERTGTLEHTLKTSADFYDRDVDSTLKDLTTFLEPSLLLFMGLVIGIIAVSILQPIYQLVGAF